MFDARVTHAASGQEPMSCVVEISTAKVAPAHGFRALNRTERSNDSSRRGFRLSGADRYQELI